ncbi:MAG: hypothetical protein KAJ19_15085 [Gammaproteobacteria bacterium]|nr:hypothetical protein [Gammaproteobacteria bacterium]
MKKTYSVIGEKRSEKGKKANPILISIGIAFIVMIVLLLYIFITSVKISENEIGKENNSELTNLEGDEKREFAVYFPGCNSLNSKCLDSNCDQYFLCNDEKYKVCEIYDCGAEFGIGTKDENGEVKIERKVKDNREKIIKIKNKCSGSLEIAESGYANERLEAKIKVATVGDCEIGGFLVSCRNPETDESGNFKPAKFSSLDNNFYLISVSNCVEISEVIAIGENGISIK